MPQGMSTLVASTYPENGETEVDMPSVCCCSSAIDSINAYAAC